MPEIASRLHALEMSFTTFHRNRHSHKFVDMRKTQRTERAGPAETQHIANHHQTSYAPGGGLFAIRIAVFLM